MNARLMSACLLVCALCGGPSRALGKAPTRPQVAALPGGGHLVTVTLPESDTVSFRLVVGAGGASDTSEHKGLAHLLEHMLFLGNERTDGRDLCREIRTVGGSFNGATTADATSYAVDIPKLHADRIIGRFIHIIENPQFTKEGLDAERDVVKTEAYAFSPLGMGWAVDQMLFPAQNAGLQIIGSERTRSTVRLENLIAFYQNWYHADNVTYVVAGPWTHTHAREVIEQARVLPPDREGRSSLPPDEPTTPTEASIRSPASMALFGYLVAPRDADACPALAAALNLHARRQLLLRSPSASDVTVACHEIRGNVFIIANGFGPSEDASTLLDKIEAVFQNARRRPFPASDVRLVQQHLKALRKQRLGSSSAAADWLVESAASRVGTTKERLSAAFDERKVTRGFLHQLAQRTFTAPHRISLRLSPYIQ